MKRPDSSSEGDQRSTPSTSAPTIVLWVLIVAYAAFFSLYTLQRHATFNTFAADLSYIDQPMWNTVHGRFLERTLGTDQVSRVAEHLELILAPLSLVYLVWSDVRAMLIIQTLALALGALPVFWIARRTFTGMTGEAEKEGRAEWLALAFSLAYLLSPALQAANVADFHADPLVVAPLLFTFWYATERRWRLMWVWALLVMAGKENLSTLTAMVGLFLVFSELLQGRRFIPTVKHGLLLFVVSVAWFYAATFLIVAPLAQEVYGTDGPVYLANRYIEFGATPGDWLRGAVTALSEPARLDYLAGLFGAVGWLALLAPEYLLIGLPVLVANTFSNFPGQYSGEQHYSAPLVAVFVIAAIYGARRLQRFLEGQMSFRLTPYWTNTTIVSVLGIAWLLVWSGGAQLNRGWTPIARPFQWPATTEHHRALARLADQIPADAPVSATPAVHPHLAHRHKIYVYPNVSDATHVLVDVAGVTDMHPTDVKSSVQRLIEDGDFGIVDAADGFILLARGAGGAELTDDFYSFVSAKGRRPEIPVDARFGRSLRLLGYDVVDDTRRRLTHFRFYWQVEGALEEGTTIHYEARTPSGQVVDSSEQRPLPALLWYSPAQWQPGEIIVTETVPWFLPRAFAPILRVESGGQVLRAELSAVATVSPALPNDIPSQAATPRAEVAADGALRLPALARRAGSLALYEGPLTSIETVDFRFASDGWTVRLAEWSAAPSAAPGRNFTVLFYWIGAGAAPQNLHIFLHLRDATGQTVAQSDGPPTWFLPRPPTDWVVQDDGTAGAIDAHTIALPQDLPPGRYELVVGWYDFATGARLARIEGFGNRAGDEAVLGPVTVDPLAGPRPDACCLAAEACCDSLE